MSESEALLYDHAQDLQLEIERPLPDWGGDEVFATVPRRRRFAPPEPTPRDPVPRAVVERFERDPAPQPVQRDEPPAYEVGANGRRTVVITGRPFDQPRRRPVRTVDERIAHRPDRIAAWAVGLGFGLVIAALATAPL